MKSKASAYIGFAINAGNAAVGHYACQTLIKANKAGLLVCSTLASEGTKKKYSDLCKQYKAEFILAESCVFDDIGKRDVKLIAICDNNLIKEILQKAEPNSTGGAVIR